MPSRTITYTLSVTVTRAIEDDADPADYQTRHEIRSLERDVLRVLCSRHEIDGDIDIECLETEVSE